MQYIYLFALFCAAFVAPAYALSCIPCSERECEEVTCRGNKVKDVCGCCDACAKLEDEVCGGPWDISGLCDHGLFCQRVVSRDALAFNVEGTCRRNDTRCPLPMAYNGCASACQLSCDVREVAICTLNCASDPCVCGPGYIRRSVTDQTCIPIEDCPERTCEFPKIFKRCATSCPATCGNPHPSICTRDCSIDPCLCPDGFVMKSLTERRCIKAFECEDFSFCKKDCPTLRLDASPCELEKAWWCELANWKCTSYAWKMSVEKWWNDNDCAGMDSALHLWDDMPECEYMPLDCVNAENKKCSQDPFGCWSCECTDGKYADNKQVKNIWMRDMKMYQLFQAGYGKARENCTSGPSIGCGGA